MSSKVSLVFVICIIFGFKIAVAEDFNIKPGLWKTTNSMKVEGVPPQMAAMMEQQVPQIETECVKDNKVDFVPKDMGENCTFEKTSSSAKKLTWRFECKDGGGTAKGKGEVNYNSTSVSGWMDVKTGGPNGASMRMRHSFKSKRVGPCD